MPDVRFGIDASGAAAGARQYIDQLKLIRQEALRTQQILNQAGGDLGAREAARQYREQTAVLRENTKAKQDNERAERQAERTRLQRIRSGLAYLKQTDAENKAWAQQQTQLIRTASALGQTLRSKNLLAAVEARVSAAITASNAAMLQQTRQAALLAANLSGANGALARLSGQFLLLRRNMATAAVQARQFGANLTRALDQARASASQRFGRALTRTLTLPFALAAGAAVKFELDLRRTFTSIQTLAEESAEGAAKLREEVLKLAPAVGIGPRELARALYSIESVGFQGAEAMDILAKSAQAAAIGLGDTQVVAKTIVSAVTTWAEAGLTAAEATNQLLVAVQLGGAEADSFATTLGRVIAIAKEAGATFAQTTAFLATFTRLGVRTDEAITALRQALALFVRVPTEQTREALRRLGLEIEDVRELSAEKGLAGAFIELINRARRMGVEIGSLFPNIRALAGQLATAGSQAEEYARIEELVTNSTGKLASAFKITQASGSLVYAQFKAAAESALILAAEQTGLAQAVAGVAVSLTGLINAFSDLSPQAKTALATMALFAGVVGPLTISIGLLAQVMRVALLPAIRQMGTAFSRSQLLVGGIIAATLLVGEFIRIWRSLQEALQARKDIEAAGTDLEKIDDAGRRAAAGIREFAVALADLTPILGVLVGGVVGGGPGAVIGGTLGLLISALVRIGFAAADSTTDIADFKTAMEGLAGALPQAFGLQGPAAGIEALKAGLSSITEQTLVARKELRDALRERERLASTPQPSGYRPTGEPIFLSGRSTVGTPEQLAAAEAKITSISSQLIGLQTNADDFNRAIDDALETQAKLGEGDEITPIIEKYAEWFAAAKELERQELIKAQMVLLSAEAQEKYADSLEITKIWTEAVNAAVEDGLTGQLLQKYALQAYAIATNIVAARRAAEDAELRIVRAQDLRDLEFATELIRLETGATAQGEDALRAFRIEREIMIKQREIENALREKSKAYTEEEIKDILAATRAQAEANEALAEQQEVVRNAKKAQEDAAREYQKIWDNLIENVQRAWGDMFTDVIRGGKNAFKDFGDFLKDLFTRLAGELAALLIFEPIIRDIQTPGTVPGATSGQGSTFQFLSKLTTSIVDGLTDFFGGGGVVQQPQQPQAVILPATAQGQPQLVLNPFKAAGSPSAPTFSGAAQPVIISQPAGSTALGGGSSSLGGLASLFSLFGSGPLASLVASAGASSGGLFGPIVSGVGAVGTGLLSGFGTSIGASNLGIALGNSLTQLAGGQFTTISSLGLGLGQALGTSFSPASIIGGIGGTLIGRSLGYQGLSGVGGTLATTALTGLGAYAGSVAATAIGSALGGAAAGAAAGSVVPVIGTIIGAIIGALVAAFAGGKSSTPQGQLVTRPTLEALQAVGLERGLGIFRETPFGFVGLAGAGTTGAVGKGSTQEALLGIIQTIDFALAQALTQTERELVKAAQLPDLFANAKRIDEKFAGQRIGTVLRVLGLEQFFPGELTTTSAEEQLSRVLDFLGRRKEIKDLIDQLNGVVEVAPEAERALNEVELALLRIQAEGPQVGVVIDDIAALRATALQNLIDDFNKTISDAILGFVDPSTLAIDQLAESQLLRLQEAERLGADLVEVERLTGLERQELLKQINEPIQQTIDALRFSPSGSTPTTALAAAEQRFFDAALSLQQQTGEFTTQDLASAAQTFLSLGEQFLGAPSFAQQREEILSILEAFLVDSFPGDEMNDQLSNLNLETARGNAVSEQQLNLLIDSSQQMQAELALLRAQLDRLLAA